MMMTNAVKLWTRTLFCLFDDFEQHLRPLYEEVEGDQEVIEWEENERSRLEEWIDIVNETEEERKFDEPDTNSIDEWFDDMEKITFPDLPFNEGHKFDAMNLMLRATGNVLMKAREERKKMLVTMVINKPNTLRDNNNPDAPHQSSINGDHRITSSWLHNFVCVHAHVLQCASHMNLTCSLLCL